MFFKRGLKAASFGGVLLFSACGGGGSATDSIAVRTVSISSKHDLVLSANTPVAGVQWAMDMTGVELSATELATNARKLLGGSVQVLQRPAVAPVALVQSASVHWLLFSPESAGHTNIVLATRSKFSNKVFPVSESVLCADSFGNPVRCSLVWQQQ